MPSSNPDVNEAFAAYKASMDSTRPEQESVLIKALQNYARKIVWLTLRETRPEIVNEAVHYVLGHLDDFRGNSKFSTWVFAIVRRFCYGDLQRRTRRKETLFSEFKDYEIDGLATYELDGDAKMTLDRLRRTLTNDENRLIEFKLQGFTHAEIAQELSATTATIDGRWRRLCEKLRQTQTSNKSTPRNNANL